MTSHPTSRNCSAPRWTCVVTGRGSGSAGAQHRDTVSEDTGMEGILYKWTNYLSGWQPRWFLLYGGILSYYDSKEDAWKGCKGSIQMAVCEIQVHPTDNTRVDLAIPGEQYFYLKARTAAERQRWLVALGSAKACITDFRTKKGKEFSDNTDILKKKMSELRLYCDIMVQQVTKTKETATISSSESQENIDMGALLKSTCNTFLKTLEECMQIANTTFSSHLVHATPPGSPHLSVLKPGKVRRSTSYQIPAHRKIEVNNNLENGSLKDVPNPKAHSINELDHLFGVEISRSVPSSPVYSVENNHLCVAQEASESVSPGTDSSVVVDRCDGGTGTQAEFLPVTDASHQADGGGSKEDEGGGIEDDGGGIDNFFQTFFSVMTHRFSDITLDNDDGIPTEYFLQSCYAVVPVLDKLGSTVFAPVKMDFVGNIKKINQKYITNKEAFTTLQKIVLHEVNASVAQVRNSATEALLWLKRGLKFLYEFLNELKNGERNIQAALSNAYGKTLRQYHGWVVRGVFALALRAAPSYDGFVTALTIKEGSGTFFDAMQRDLDIYLPAMGKQLCLLDTLYEEHGLESDDVV